MIKLFGLAVLAALVLLAVAGATPAAATTYHIESCTENEKECKTSSVGTTYETTSDEFVVKAGEKVLDECKVTMVMKVIDPTTEKKGDEMEMSVTKMQFTECTESGIEAEGLPWIEEADAVSYESTQAFEIRDFTYNIFGCSYKPDNISHTVLRDIFNEKGFRLTETEGDVLLKTGWFFCSALTSFFLHSSVGLLVDASFPKATEMRIG
jgi:hypothetical protein